MRDAEMRSAGKYRFYIYDKFNHLVVQGLCSSRPTSTAVFNATLGTSGGLLSTGYSYPSGLGTVELEIVNYYDGNQSGNSLFSSLTLPSTSVSQKGQLTGVVTAATNGELLVQAMQYDIKGNIINSKANDTTTIYFSNSMFHLRENYIKYLPQSAEMSKLYLYSFNDTLYAREEYMHITDIHSTDYNIKSVHKIWVDKVKSDSSDYWSDSTFIKEDIPFWISVNHRHGINKNWKEL